MFDLFCVFFKIGLFSFGGGYAMVPLMQQELVSKHAWLTSAQLTDFMAVAQVPPGAFAVNTATIVGWSQYHFPGALVATAGVMTPSVLIMLAVAWCLKNAMQNLHVQAALKGMRPAVIGVIGAAVWSLGNLFFFPVATSPNFTALAIFALLLLLEWRFKLHPLLLILLSMLLGCLFFSIK